MKKIRSIFFYCALIGGGVGLWWFSQTRIYLLNSALSCVSYPFLILQNACIEPLHRWSAERSLKTECFEKYNELERQYQKLFGRVVELEALLLHERSIQALLDFQERYQNQVCCAQIIFKALGESEQYMILDKGTVHGVHKDMVAVVDNCVLGRIVETYPLLSKLILITHPLCKIPIVCASSQARAVHEGDGRLDEAHLEFMSHLEQPQIGELVLTSGDGLVYPAGFALSTVSACALDELGFLYNITTVPRVDFHRVRFCSIISKGAHAYEYHEEVA